jgi:hypothetical protein
MQSDHRGCGAVEVRIDRVIEFRELVAAGRHQTARVDDDGLILFATEHAKRFA